MQSGTRFLGGMHVRHHAPEMGNFWQSRKGILPSFNARQIQVDPPPMPAPPPRRWPRPSRRSAKEDVIAAPGAPVPAPRRSAEAHVLTVGNGGDPAQRLIHGGDIRRRRGEPHRAGLGVTIALPRAADDIGPEVRMRWLRSPPLIDSKGAPGRFRRSITFAEDQAITPPSASAAAAATPSARVASQSARSFSRHHRRITHRRRISPPPAANPRSPDARRGRNTANTAAASGGSTARDPADHVDQQLPRRPASGQTRTSCSE